MKTVTETKYDAEGRVVKEWVVVKRWVDYREAHRIYIARSAADALKKAEEDDCFYDNEECCSPFDSPGWTVKEK